jgi:hypothetical protein
MGIPSFIPIFIPNNKITIVGEAKGGTTMLVKRLQFLIDSFIKKSIHFTFLWL